jgi:GT2 family glycosyltransferase
VKASLPPPRIAVLLPTYNPGPELQGSLDSLRKQTVPFCLFLVDDGSKRPGNYDALTQGMNVHILRLPQNLGITGAMNAGLDEIMSGTFDYIVRLDTGDFCAPDRFEKQLAHMDANQDIGILGSAVLFRLFNAKGEKTGELTMPFPKTPDACIHRLFINSPVIHPAMMIRRVVFQQLRHYSEKYPAAEDYDLLWRAHKAGFKLANLPQTLLIKEETPGSISQSRRRRQVWSRLHIQWDNRDVANALSWKGLIRTAIIWALPAWAINGLKFGSGR